MQRDEARDIKNRAIAGLARAFTNPVRLQLVGVLNQGEASVDVLARKSGQSKANASAQLKVLLDANIVSVRREGRHAYYRLRSEAVRRLWSALQEVAAGEDPGFRELVRVWFGQPGSLDRRAGRELLSDVRDGRVVLVDLRPRDEYEAGHVPGATSIPPEELDRRMQELPDDREIVAYCRGRYCVLAAEGTARMREAGLRARNLFAGVPDWRAHRLPVREGSDPEG